MAALIIPQSTSFGGMTNQIVSRIIGLNTQMERLKDAITTAASGYGGVAGTEYEAGGYSMVAPNAMSGPNNFGVQPDSTEPGANGLAYAYAFNVLSEQWSIFWAAAEASLAQLDNGGNSM
jgi:hypothetical protein